MLLRTKLHGKTYNGMSGAKAACSTHGSPSGYDRVRFSGLPRAEAGIYPAEHRYKMNLSSFFFHPSSLW